MLLQGLPVSGEPVLGARIGKRGIGDESYSAVPQAGEVADGPVGSGLVVDIYAGESAAVRPSTCRSRINLT
jgi:hypothetical protein